MLMNEGEIMRKKVFLIITLATIVSLTLIASPVTAEEKAQTTPSKTQASQPATQTANGVTQSSLKAGVRTCAGRINQITNFLTAGANAGYLLFFSQTNPDQHMTSISMEVPLKDNIAYASVNVAPRQANYCDGIYETVVYWPQNCAVVNANNFSTFKKAGLLSKNISVLDGGATKVFLMPAGTGCISIKKEMVR
jgi:hypothetical protein